MVEFVLLFHNGSRDSIMAAGGSISAAENQERPPRNCIAVACETPSWQQENAHHSGRLYPTKEGETISRRHERGCVLSGRGKAYHGVTRDSLCPIEAGEPIMAARVIRCLSCHEGRLYHSDKRASMSIVAASIDWQHCPAAMPWVCGHFLDRGLW